MIFCCISVFPKMSSAYEIDFSGFKWQISERKNVPGVGVYSKKTIFVDELGRLHLQLKKNDTDAQQLFSELKTTVPLSYGAYRIVLSKGWSALHPNLVFGFFNFPQSNLSMAGLNEIDIELSHWGVPNGKNIQFGLYTADISKRNLPVQRKFSLTTICAKLILSFTWLPNQIKYAAECGAQNIAWDIVDEDNRLIPDFPMPLFINLWVFRAKSEEIIEHEFIVDEFEYSPL